MGPGILALALLLLAAPGDAQPQRVRMEVMISQISTQPGEIDARAGKLHRKLRDQMRYESLKVLQTRELELALDEVGEMRLPNGRKFQVRPLSVDSHGVLTAVSLEGSVDADMRIPNGHLVVIGAEPFEDGKLVVSLEPHY
jgi:hypothetical protein